MSELKLQNALIRVSNENDTESPYRITASIHVDVDNNVKGVRSGNVRLLSSTENVAAFDCQEDGNVNYQFSPMTSTERKALMDAIDTFISNATNATVSVSI